MSKIKEREKNFPPSVWRDACDFARQAQESSKGQAGISRGIQMWERNQCGTLDKGLSISTDWSKQEDWRETQRRERLSPRGKEGWKPLSQTALGREAPGGHFSSHRRTKLTPQGSSRENRTELSKSGDRRTGLKTTKQKKLKQTWLKSGAGEMERKRQLGQGKGEGNHLGWLAFWKGKRMAGSAFLHKLNQQQACQLLGHISSNCSCAWCLSPKTILMEWKKEPEDRGKSSTIRRADNISKSGNELRASWGPLSETPFHIWRNMLA